MRYRLHLLIYGGTFCLLCVLSACGVTNIPSTGASIDGPVSIHTDHSTYQPGDVIKVSVFNNEQRSIFSYDSRASCTILDLQFQVNGAWQTSKIARCTRASRARLIELPAGKTYHASISAGTAGVQSPGFLRGTYRLVLRYTTSSINPSRNMTTIYSAPITVA